VRGAAGRRVLAGLAGFELTLVLVVVALKAQQFPVAAVGRIVVMIVVAMVHRQFAHIGMAELPRAATADPGVDFQRLLAVALFTLFGGAARVGDDTVEFGRIGGFHVAVVSLSADYRAHFLFAGVDFIR
jgi:hypothetical protein